MAKKKQQRIAAKDRRDAKKFFRVLVIGTLILILLLYLVYRNS